MLHFRQRGLANVYTVTTTVGAVLVLLLIGELDAFVPLIDLAATVNLVPYCLAVVVGMVASAGYLRENAQSLSHMRTGVALAIAFRQTAFVAACIFAFMFAAKDRSVSRVFLAIYLIGLFGGLTVALMYLPNYLAGLFFGQKSRLPTLFIGSVSNLEDLDTWIRQRGHLGIDPVGFLDDNEQSRADRVVAPHLGSVADLPRVLAQKRIGQVILLEWLEDAAAIDGLIECCDREGVRFLIHNNYGARFARTLIPIEEGGRHFLALQQEPLEDPIHRGIKRLLDLLIALPVVIFVLPPITVVVAVMQALQAPGPVLFVRPRGGQNRREFSMFKFRSMKVHNEDISRQATANDNRTFPFGRIMRKTSIDELPQFINVVLGQMSVVGPRPHLPEHDTEFSRVESSYYMRSLVKPGITGLAQVRGYRGEITDPEKLERRVYWDLYYVNHWSPWLDIFIILKTGWQVVRPPETAY